MEYAIGDIQGCFTTLMTLLEQIQFDEKKDVLWLTGDLVNRGPDSLATLRFIHALGSAAITVLGNHDLHLLALAHNAHPGWDEDTLHDVLNAPDRDELIAWLLQLPLLHQARGLTLVHAGLAPAWDLIQAKRLAMEVSAVLTSEARFEFFKHMYGNHPDQWSDALTGFDRLRCIVNYFTRVRRCYPDGRMILDKKVENLTSLPWYQLPQRKTQNEKIIFGHWAALSGVTNTPNVYALDTGCVWGYQLTAMRLTDFTRFSVPAEK